MQRLHVVFLLLSTFCAILFTMLLINHNHQMPNRVLSERKQPVKEESDRVFKRAAPPPANPRINLTSLVYFVDDVKFCQQDFRPENMQAFRRANEAFRMILDIRSPILCVANFAPDRTLNKYEYDVFLLYQPYRKLLQDLANIHALGPLVAEHACSPYIDPDVAVREPIALDSGCNCIAYTSPPNDIGLVHSVHVATDWVCCCLPRAVNTATQSTKPLELFDSLDKYLDVHPEEGMPSPV
ncbi:hypothetical protein M3Y94_00604200 [Aphelenchoides besseyi]|nr:hypothetical protein M3Y94_00604200 [Aphelenchoides besseyi]KAI6222252.1 hypothetical protein M3Y95_00965200 [Aphelenchoides besseyi]